MRLLLPSERSVFSPASERNKEPIRQVLAEKLAHVSTLLELACGSLQHACHIAPDHPHLIWQPSDIDPRALEHGQEIELPDNVRRPLFLDVTGEHWPLPQVDAIFSANLLHISEREVLPALFSGADRLGAVNIFIYGPFSIDGKHTSQGNIDFDASLRSRNSDWGIHDLGDVKAAATEVGFSGFTSTDMPANNLFLHFWRA